MPVEQPKMLYYSLMEEIIKQIEDNSLPVGTMISSERELMEKYKMSRTTVRRALDQLVNEGYLRKKQGKGTFVAEKKLEQGLIKITSCTNEIKEAGLTPHYKTISAEIINASYGVASKLGIKEGDKIFRLERVLYADEYPVNITATHLVYDLVPGIEKYDFEKESLYNICEEVYHLVIRRAVRSLEPSLAGDRDAPYLQIAEDVPTLLFKATVYSAPGIGKSEVPFEYFVSRYRCDKFKFYLEQTAML